MALEEIKAVQMVAAERKDSYCPGTGWRWVTGRWTACKKRVSPVRGCRSEEHGNRG